MRNKILIVFVIFLLNSAFGKINEDDLIIKALYFENSNPKEAAEVWKELFKLTNNDRYLIEYFNTALEYKNIKDVIIELREVLNKKKNKELYELLTALYIKEGSNNSALDAISLLEQTQDLDIDKLYQLAYFYTLTNNDKKALEIYQKIYNKEKSWESLKGILAVLAKDKKIDKIKNILWHAVQNNKNLPTEAYLVLAGLLDLQKDTKKAIYIFDYLYKTTLKNEYLKQLIGLYLYEKDYKNLLALLNQTHYDDKLLYEILVANKEYLKAFLLLDKLYKKTKDPQLLAEKAILSYEIADKYKAVDEGVIRFMGTLFEDAFKKGVKKALYYNYYGYTLIDNKLDIKKGIKYVKKALEEEPDNIYYLDSLAWGYFKLKDCKNALKIVNKLKNQGDIEEKEIKDHLEKIFKECKER